MSGNLNKSAKTKILAAAQSSVLVQHGDMLLGWYGFARFVGSLTSFVRSFHCYAITSSHGKFTFCRHVLSFFSAFSIVWRNYLFLHILVGGFCVFDFSSWCDHDYSPMSFASVCVHVFWMMLSKNMCYEMAKFANKHVDRLHCRKVFRLLIDFSHSACHFQASRFATFFSHILWNFWLFLLSIPLCDNSAWSHFDENLPILCVFVCWNKSVLTGSLFSFSFQRGDFWHKMIDISAKRSSINSMHSKNAVENLLYTHTLALSRVISTTNRVWK